MVGKVISFNDGSIMPGGFPAGDYYLGDPAKATVTIDCVSADDAAKAERAMREKLGDPNWKTPKEYRWHYAGSPGSTTMELVSRNTHEQVHHIGPAAPSRAARKPQAPPASPKGAKPGIMGRLGRGAAKCLKPLNLYDAFKEYWETKERAKKSGAPFMDQLREDNDRPFIEGPINSGPADPFRLETDPEYRRRWSA